MAPEFRLDHTVRRAVVRISQHLSARGYFFEHQKEDMREFRKRNKDLFEDTDGEFPNISQQAFHRYMNGQGKKSTTGRTVFKIAWVYFWNYNGGVLISRAFDALVLEENEKIPHPLVGSIKHLIDRSFDIDVSILKRLRGRYMMLRPFFWKISEIMIHELICGEEQLSRFSVVISFPEKGKTVHEVVTGHIIPLSDSILFVGSIEKIDVPFVFILHDVEKSKHDGNYGMAEGVLIVGANRIAPSAFPLLVLRSDDEIVPTVVRQSELPKNISELEEFKVMISRHVTSIDRYY